MQGIQEVQVCKWSGSFTKGENGGTAEASAHLGLQLASGTHDSGMGVGSECACTQQSRAPLGFPVALLSLYSDACTTMARAPGVNVRTS